MFLVLIYEGVERYDNTTVLFIETHWITGTTIMLYFKFLSNFYWGKKVGLVYDNAPSYYSKAVNDYAKAWNENPKKN